MASLIVSRKVGLIKPWSEDVVTDEILNKIAAQARTEKGKKFKIKISEAGLSLTRVRLFFDNETKFFPIKTTKTVMQIPGFPRCVLFIVSDLEKKYKIIPLKCESEADAAKLATFFAEIQNKGESENLEFRKWENGNWSLRGRTDHNSNQVQTEIFSEHKQSNGDLTAVKINGDVTHVPVIDAKEKSKKESHAGATSGRGDNNELDRNIVSDDDIIIETEVEAGASVPAKIRGEERETRVVSSEATRTEPTAVEEAPTIVSKSRKSHFLQASILPSRPTVKRLPSSTVTLPQPFIYRATSQPVVYAATSRNMENSQPVVYRSTSRTMENSQPVVYRPPSRNMENSQPIVYRSTSRHMEQSQPVVYRPPSRNTDHIQPVVYAATSRRTEPPQTVVYTATSTGPIIPQPDGQGTSSQPYLSETPTVTTTSAGFFTNPWALRQMSRERSSARAAPSSAGIKFDQQSLMSNTSRLSRFSRLRASETSIPTTIERSIENVYPRPNMLMRPSRQNVGGHRPRPASYHANELKVYYEDDGEAGFPF